MTKIAAVPSRLLSGFFILLINFYRKVISPMLPPSCRFYPTCSQYSLEAIHRHGPVKGLVLSTVRIVKCNPLHPGGHDPVPEHFHLFKGPEITG